jgi:hypothetical protein
MSEKIYGRSQQDIGWWTFRRLEEEAEGRHVKRVVATYYRGQDEHAAAAVGLRPFSTPVEVSDAITVRLNRRNYASERLLRIEVKQAAREVMGGKDPLVDWLIENLLPKYRYEFGEILYVMPCTRDALMDLADDCHWTICDTFHDLLAKAEQDGVL